MRAESGRNTTLRALGNPTPSKGAKGGPPAGKLLMIGMHVLGHTRHRAGIPSAPAGCPMSRFFCETWDLLPQIPMFIHH